MAVHVKKECFMFLYDSPIHPGKTLFKTPYKFLVGFKEDIVLICF